MTNVSICVIKAILVNAKSGSDQSYGNKNIGTLKLEKKLHTKPNVKLGITKIIKIVINGEIVVLSKAKQ